MLWTTHRTSDEGNRGYRTIRLQLEEFVDDEFPKSPGTDDGEVGVGRHGERVDYMRPSLVSSSLVRRFIAQQKRRTPAQFLVTSINSLLIVSNVLI